MTFFCGYNDHNYALNIKALLVFVYLYFGHFNLTYIECILNSASHSSFCPQQGLLVQ